MLMKKKIIIIKIVIMIAKKLLSSILIYYNKIVLKPYLIYEPKPKQTPNKFHKVVSIIFARIKIKKKLLH